VDEPQPYPVRIEGQLDTELSRWLWLVKWFLAIPHYIVLALLWLTLLVLTIVAFFAILLTGRYPRGIFDFNVGVLRWTWRVAFYSYGALGTDRYPPFTLDDVPDYPARLEVAYPEQLSRGLVLVKWWLLAIPQYIVTGIFLGGGSYAAAQVDDWFWGIGFETGLIGILVLFAGVALLSTTRYPGGLFDFVVGLDRWVARVAAYVLLMRDEYPPFRLDQGGTEAEGLAAPTFAVAEAPVPVAGEPAAPAAEPTSASPAAAVAGEPAAPPARKGWTGGRIALVVVGTIAGLLALGLLVGGCALVAVDQTQRDDDGFLMSPTQDFSTPTYAIVSESADLDTEGGEWALDTFLGTVRIRSESDRPVFVGIGPADEVTRYLGGVERDVVDDLDNSGDPEYSRRSGGAPTGQPGDETFWVASTAGAGERTLEWEPEDGDWQAVVMNEDASRGVSAELSIGAELDSVLWIGAGLLLAGALFAAGSALAITAATRSRTPRSPASSPDALT
jgi:hypothetical protein